MNVIGGFLNLVLKQWVALHTVWIHDLTVSLMFWTSASHGTQPLNAPLGMFDMQHCCPVIMLGLWPSWRLPLFAQSPARKPKCMKSCSHYCNLENVTSRPARCERRLRSHGRSGGRSKTSCVCRCRFSAALYALPNSRVYEMMCEAAHSAMIRVLRVQRAAAAALNQLMSPQTLLATWLPFGLFTIPLQLTGWICVYKVTAGCSLGEQRSSEKTAQREISPRNFPRGMSNRRRADREVRRGGGFAAARGRRLRLRTWLGR